MVLQDLYVPRVPRPFLPMFRARMQVSGSALSCWLTCAWSAAAPLPDEGCLGGAWEAGCILAGPRSPHPPPPGVAVAPPPCSPAQGQRSGPRASWCHMPFLIVPPLGQELLADFHWILNFKFANKIQSAFTGPFFLKL